MQELIEGQDYQVVDDGMGGLQSYLSRTSRNAVRKAMSIANRALAGKKGNAATTAILLANLTADKEAFRATFGKYKQEINEYFEHVDLQAAGELMGLEDSIVQSSSSALRGAGYVSAGILLGIAGVTLYNRQRKQP